MAKIREEDIILTGRAKELETKALHRKAWKFPMRTCTNCELYPCFNGIENCKSDFAKYGCVKYRSKGKYERI